jgi:hypothetical protein
MVENQTARLIGIISCMGLPARRTMRTVAHVGVVTGLVALVAVVFGVVGWEGELIVVGVIAAVAIVVAAYVLSRP